MHQTGCVYKPAMNSSVVLPTGDSVGSLSTSNPAETSEIKSLKKKIRFLCVKTSFSF